MTATDVTDSAPAQLQFEDNRLLPALFGHHDEHLVQIERLLDVKLRYRGNRLEIVGPAASRAIAERAIERLYRRLTDGHDVNQGEVQAAVRMADAGGEEMVIRTRRRHISPRSPTQADYLAALGSHDLVFGLGPAGTGKTYLAVARAVEALEQEEVRRIILVRPAVEAGERLGFLPGDLMQKIDPYLRPMYDALYEMLGFERVARLVEKSIIEVAPLAFMRGRSLSESFVILDEAQNTSAEQMKMFLTRIGFGSRAVVTGDITQTDLPRGQESGLNQVVRILSQVRRVSFSRFDAQDVVRHPLVQAIVEAYEKHDEKD